MRRADGAVEFLDRPVAPADRAAALADIDWAAAVARETAKPVALVVRPGLFVAA